ncbi:MAG: hypothetical protein IT214_04600 [Chitinophagaceae bacterium]|nr:hypothetical protein [Chitinophagaceae bacterium]
MEGTFINNTKIGKDKIEQQLFNLFWVGLIIYFTAFAAIKGFPQLSGKFNLLQALGLGLFIPASIGLSQHRVKNLFYTIYLLWSGFTVFRGMSFQYSELKASVYDPDFGLLVYLVPFIMLFKIRINIFKGLFNTTIILGLIFIVLCFYFRSFLLMPEDDENRTGMGLLEVFTRFLEIPFGFLLITYRYHKIRRRILSFLVVLMTLILSLIRARRGLIFFQSSFLIFGMILYIWDNKKNLAITMFTLFIAGVMIFFSIGTFKENKNGMFTKISERVNEDTRSGVEQCFYDDMKVKDWLIGKGINGTYYCPGIDQGSLIDYRNVIETGFLNIILNQGLVGLVLLLLIMIPAIYKGLFWSNNLLSKAAGIWILMWLLDLYPAVVYIFSLNYILVWMCISFCYTPSMRKMSDEKILQALRFK